MRDYELSAQLHPANAAQGIPWEAFEGAQVLVTGATGLVGSNVLELLLVDGGKLKEPPIVYALVRDQAKARLRLADLPQENLRYVVGDVAYKMDLNVTPDYIVHAAARTDSVGMVKEPLAVIASIIDGTRNVLDFAQECCAKQTVFVSSMEVYGAFESEDSISEHTFGKVDQLSIRSSYPESKRMAENICCAFASERNVPVCIARLAQCIGSQLRRDDKRLVSYLANCVIDCIDIMLETDGKSTRMYVSAADAAAAILVLLVKGLPGEAYNVANEETYCSIAEMAAMVSREIAQGEIAVQVGCGDVERFPPAHHLRLNTQKLRELGWVPIKSLRQMFIELTS